MHRLYLAFIVVLLAQASTAADLFVDTADSGAGDCSSAASRCAITKLPALLTDGSTVLFATNIYENVSLTFGTVNGVTFRSEVPSNPASFYSFQTNTTFQFYSATDLVIDSLKFYGKNPLQWGSQSTSPTITNATLSNLYFNGASIAIHFTMATVVDLVINNVHFDALSSNGTVAAPIFFEVTSMTTLTYTNSKVTNSNFNNCPMADNFLDCVGRSDRSHCATNILHSGLGAFTWQISNISILESSATTFSAFQFLNQRYNWDQVENITIQDVTIYNSAYTITPLHAYTLLNSMGGIKDLTIRRVNVTTPAFQIQPSSSAATTFGAYGLTKNVVIEDSYFSDGLGASLLFIPGHLDGITFKNNKVKFVANWNADFLLGGTMREALFQNVTINNFFGTAVYTYLWQTTYQRYSCPSFVDANNVFPFNNTNIVFRDFNLESTPTWTGVTYIDLFHLYTIGASNMVVENIKFVPLTAATVASGGQVVRIADIWSGWAVDNFPLNNLGIYGLTFRNIQFPSTMFNPSTIFRFYGVMISGMVVHNLLIENMDYINIRNDQTASLSALLYIFYTSGGTYYYPGMSGPGPVTLAYNTTFRNIRFSNCGHSLLIGVDSNLNGVTFENIYLSNHNYVGNPAFNVLLAANSQLTFTNVTFVNAAASLLEVSASAGQRAKFIGDKITVSGRKVEGAAAPVFQFSLVDATISQLTATANKGSSALIYANANVTVVDSTFDSNEVDIVDVLTNNSQFVMTGSTISSTTPTAEGGVFFFGNDEIAISLTDVTVNSTTGYVFRTRGTDFNDAITISGCTFAQNAIVFDLGLSRLEISGSWFESNAEVAFSNATLSDSLSLVDTHFVNNHKNNSNALMLTPTGTAFTLTNVVVTSATARNATYDIALSSVAASTSLSGISLDSGLLLPGGAHVVSGDLSVTTLGFSNLLSADFVVPAATTLRTGGIYADLLAANSSKASISIAGLLYPSTSTPFVPTTLQSLTTVSEPVTSLIVSNVDLVLTPASTFRYVLDAPVPLEVRMNSSILFQATILLSLASPSTPVPAVNTIWVIAIATTSADGRLIFDPSNAPALSIATSVSNNWPLGFQITANGTHLLVTATELSPVAPPVANPISTPSSPFNPDSPGSSSTGLTAEQTSGLAAGIAIGVVVIAAVILLVVFRKKLFKRRNSDMITTTHAVATTPQNGGKAEASGESDKGDGESEEEEGEEGEEEGEEQGEPEEDGSTSE